MLEYLNADSLQSLMYSEGYPHHALYEILHLQPDEILGKREEQIRRVAPFLERRQYSSLLDVGSSFGYFALKASGPAHRVLAIEPNQRAAGITRSVAALHRISNFEIRTVSFIDFDSMNESFDVLLALNVHHYLYKESGGLAFTRKLAALCKRWLLLEGPIDDRSTLAGKEGPRDSFPDFEKVLQALSAFFTIEHVEDSMIPGRRLARLERRNFREMAQIQETELGLDTWRQIQYPNPKRTSLMVATNGLKVAKYYPLRFFPFNTINALSEVDSRVIPAEGIVMRGDTFAGYLAPFVEGARADRSLVLHREAVRRNLVDLQCGLSRMGQIFYDISPENFLITGSGEVRFVDLKSLINVPYHVTIKDRARYYRAALAYGITCDELQLMFEYLPRADWDVERDLREISAG